jgi:hypothetical protein
MNIQMRIITDENVDQMLSLSYSNNINELLQVSSTKDSNIAIAQDNENFNITLKSSIIQLKNKIKTTLTRETKDSVSELNKLENDMESSDANSEENELPNIAIDIKPSPSNEGDSDSIPYAPGSPAYQMSSDSNQEIQPGTSSPYVPDMNVNMDMELANTPMLIKKTIENTQGENVPRTPSFSPPTSNEEEKKTILEFEEEKKETEEPQQKEGEYGSTNNNTETKKIVITSENQDDNNTTSNETKKINL